MITCYDRSDDKGESNHGICLKTADEVEEVLKRLADGTPKIYDLVAESGDRLQLGLGGRFATAQYIKADNMPPYCCAKAEPMVASAEVEFLLGGTPTAIAPEFCISFDDALRIAKTFLQTGERDKNTIWEEV